MAAHCLGNVLCAKYRWQALEPLPPLDFEERGVLDDAKAEAADTRIEARAKVAEAKAKAEATKAEVATAQAEAQAAAAAEVMQRRAALWAQRCT